MYQDAVRVYSYLQKTGNCDYKDKINYLKSLIEPNSYKNNETSLSEIFIKQESNEINTEQVLNEDKDTPVKGEIINMDEVLLPEYDSLINLLFTDEDKTKLRIVPSEDFYYNSDNELVSIFSDKESSDPLQNVKDNFVNVDYSYSEILESNNDINPEVTVEDFVNILLTYYNKDTKISEIKIGDLFLLLSSIKLENN